MLKSLFAAASMVVVASTAAIAAPAATSMAVIPAVERSAGSDLLVEVGKRHSRGHYYKHHNYKHHKYKYSRYHGYHNYRRPPSNWHRYHSRPYGWSRRGCLAFGPVWYCP